MAEAQKKAIVAQLALQRSDMTESRRSLKTELSVSRQFKKSVRSHPGSWVVGGAVTAFTLALIFRRKKVIYSNFPEKKGFIGKTARLAFTLARPALTTLAIKHAKDYAEARFGLTDDNSMLGGPPQK